MEIPKIRATFEDVPVLIEPNLYYGQEGQVKDFS